MNTKLLMASSAVFLSMMGISFSFLPEEILVYLNGNSDPITLLFLQILGSLYLGFGILNWMAKPNLIGGIYSKPLAIGNLAHFGMSAIALLKIIFKSQIHIEILILLAGFYTIFAICFGYVFMKNPKKLV
ncbi:MAG: hypothetical protein ACYC01_00015 [Lutibacter sp.]